MVMDFSLGIYSVQLICNRNSQVSFGPSKYRKMCALKTQSAIIMQSRGKATVEHDLAIPSPDAFELLIRVHAVALNPSDWMALDTFARPGAGAGYDFAGEVVEMGERVSDWAVGDRLAGFVHGCT